MNILEGTNKLIGHYINALKGLGRGKIWLFITIYFFLQLLILYALYNFTFPLFYGAVAFLSSILNDKVSTAFTHYPNQLLLLSYYFGWIKFFVALLIEGLFLGAIAREFYLGRQQSTAQPESVFKFSPWLNLIIGWVVFNGLVALVTTMLPEIVSPFTSKHPRRAMVFEYLVLPFIITLLMSAFYFIIPLISAFGLKALSASKKSLSVFSKHPIFCVFLATTILSGPLLMNFINSHPSIIVEKFKPELVFWLLAVAIFIEAIANLLWMGTAVNYLSEDLD